VSKKDLEET